MAQLNGTRVISAIRPNDSLDSYPTVYTNEAKGGLHTYPKYSDLLLIPVLRRQAGMLVNITDNIVDPNYNGIYILDNDLVTWNLLSGTQTEVICGQLDNIDGSYKIVVLLASPRIYKIERIVIATSSGSCNITCNINSTSVIDYTNLSAGNISPSVYRSNSPDNYVDIDNAISLIINNISIDIGYINFQIELKRIPPRVVFPSFSVCGTQTSYQNSYS